MKKTLALTLAILLVLSLSACGAQPTTQVSSTTITAATNPSADVTPEATPETTPEATPDVTPEVTPEPSSEPAPGAVVITDARATAEALIGASAEELYAAIGEPVSSDYAPSCIGDGEDGNLYYDGFVVYTYREAGTETVEYVE